MIYLQVGVPAPENLKLCVPFHNKPWSVRRLAKKFPSLKTDLDGSAKECTLLWFYKVEGGMLVFKDTDQEEELADLMGVTFDTFNDLEESLESSSGSQKAMTSEEIAEFKAMLAENRASLHGEK